MCIFSWYTSYKLHGTRFGGEGFFEDHVRSIQKYYDTVVYVPFETETSTKFNDEEEWGIRTFRYKFADWYINFRRDSIIFKILRKLRIIKLYEIIHFLRGFRKVYKEFKPDVIDAQGSWRAGQFSVFFLRLYKIPVVITEHQLLSPRERRGYYEAFKLSQKNVCVSMGQQERLRELYQGVDFTVIYNGIFDRPVDSFGKNYRREGFINCVIVAGFYSDCGKGFQFLLPAMSILVHQFNIHLVLHICGGGLFFEHFVNLANELDISDRCIFYGSCTRNEVYSIVSQMDFGISASIAESAGVNVEEMLLLGKPVVVTKSCGANSLVTDFSAIVVEKGSTDALVEGIREMSERYKDFDSKAIREYALNTFEADISARKYMQIFEELVDRNRK